MLKIAGTHRDLGVAIAVAKHKMATVKMRQKSVVDECYLDIKPGEGLIIDLLNYYAVVTRSGDRNKSIAFFSDCPTIPTKKAEGVSIDGEVGLRIYGEGIYKLYWNKLELVNHKTGIVKQTFNFINTVPWSPQMMDSHEVIKGLHYGPVDLLDEYHKILVHMRDLSGYVDTQDVPANVKELTIGKVGEAYEITAEDTIAAYAVSPSLLSFLPGFELFRVFAVERNMFRAVMDSNAVDAKQYFDWYTTDVNGVYGWLDVTDAIATTANNERTYYEFPGPTPSVLSGSDFKITRTYYNKFFSAEESIYIYRINYMLDVFTPITDSTTDFYNAAHGVLLNTTTVTVDRLLKEDFSSTGMSCTLYEQKTNGDYRINKRFDLSLLGIGGASEFDSSTFGYGASHYTVTSTNLSLLNATPFKNATSGTMNYYNTLGIEGFTCILPVGGAVLVKEGVEYPIVFGQYVSHYEINSNLVVSDESVAILLGESGYTFIDDGYPVIPFSTDRTDSTSASFPPSLYKMGQSYALECLPRINRVVSGTDRAYFTFDHVDDNVSNRIRNHGGVYEGNVVIENGVPKLTTINRCILHELDLNECFSQAGIDDFTGTVYYKDMDQGTGYFPSVALYLITETRIEAEKLIPVTVYYIGSTMLGISGSKFAISRVAAFSIFDLDPDRWASLSSSYHMYLDAGYITDHITTQQGV